MSNVVIEIEQAAKPPLRQRLCSWKWWVYGDMNSQPLEKPLNPHWFEIIFCFCIWFFIFFQPWVATWLNRNPPSFESLQRVHGKVIRTGEFAPQFSVRLDSGEVLNLDYPDFLGYNGRHDTWMKKLGYRSGNVAGCYANVWYDSPRFTLNTRNRIWQIKCDHRLISANYTDFLKMFEDRKSLVSNGFFAFIFFPLLMALATARQRRGLLRQ